MAVTSVRRRAGLTVILTGLFVLVAASSRALAATGGLASPLPLPPQASPIPQDPPALTFEVSPDHDAVDANGPRVLKYLIEFSPIDGLGTAKTVDIGKPAAEAGVIKVPLAPLGLSAGRYLAQVRVDGPITSTVSSTAGPFQLGKPKSRPAPEAETAPAAHHHPAQPPVSGAPNSAGPTGSGDTPPADAPRTDDGAAARKRGFWRRLYGLIVGN
jgi:hypothetical protein